MKRVSQLTEELHSSVLDVYKHGTNYEIRRRAQGILLSSQGKSIKDICSLLAANRQTVSRWIKRFEREKMGCFIDSPRTGRKPILTQAEEDEIAEHQSKSYLSMSMMKSFIFERFGKKLSSETIKRLYKKESCLEADANEPEKKARR